MHILRAFSLKQSKNIIQSSISSVRSLRFLRNLERIPSAVQKGTLNLGQPATNISLYSFGPATTVQNIRPVCNTAAINTSIFSSIEERYGTNSLVPFFLYATAIVTAAAATAVTTIFSSDASEASCQGKYSKSANKALLVAVINRNLKAAEKQLEDSADPNFSHPGGWAVLHMAAWLGDIDLCNLLITKGADVNKTDSYKGKHSAYYESRMTCFPSHIRVDVDFSGFTALHYAALSGSDAVVNALLSAGANPTAVDCDNCKPSDYASSESLKLLLTEAETKFKDMKEKAAKLKRLEFPLEKRLKQFIVGQDGPIRAVAAAIRRRENQWHDEDTPLVFLFLGSSGIGKTELAKRIGEYLHENNPKAFIRFDMSEYQERHEVSKFIGSPPGYVGHENSGLLTKRLKECPNGVVLFDEVEKAHPDVLTVLLQLFDEGRITDGQGETVVCKDAIFVLTSNLAQDEIALHATDLRKQQAEGEILPSKEFRENIIRPILKKHFQRNEFIGRINEVLYFLPFSNNELRQLVELQLERWSEKAKKRHNMTMFWDTEVVEVLCREYDIHYGARSLQHAVDRLIINQIAAAHERDELQAGAEIHIHVNSNQDIELNIKNTKIPESKGLFSSLLGR